MKSETVILKNLLKNEDFSRKVLPFLKEEYFTDQADRALFGTIKEFILKYNVSPTIDTLKVEIDSLIVPEGVSRSINESITVIGESTSSEDMSWLIDSTEKFCQEKAIYNAMLKSIEIMNDKNGIHSKGSIPQMLSDALSVSFDPNVGHDYFSQLEDRYEYYHRIEERIPFDLDLFNTITRNGLPRKTLNIIMSGTGGGKSLTMCHFAASYISKGKNVLYVTLELAEEEVAKRIDANLLNISFDGLVGLDKDQYMKRVQNLKVKTNGTLIVKQYPTASASVIHIKALLNELNLKKSFRPDVIIVDYLNICASSRIKSSENSYAYVKAIAEEMRGLAVEYNVPLISATQTTRSGYVSSDPGLEDTSESFGLPATADFMFALITTDELEQLGQIMVKQLKNRYNDPNKNKRFVVGIDRSKMKLFNVDGSAQEDISDSGQDKQYQANKFNKSPQNKFKGLKV